MPQLPDGTVVPGPTIFAPLWGVAKSADGTAWIAQSIDTEIGSLMFFYPVEAAEEQVEMLVAAIHEARAQTISVPNSGLIIPGADGGERVVPMRPQDEQ